MKAPKRSDSIVFASASTQIRFPLRAGRIQPPEIWDVSSGKLLARARYFLLYEQSKRRRKIVSARHYRLHNPARGPARLEVQCVIRGNLDCTISFHFGDGRMRWFDVSVQASRPPAASGLFSLQTLAFIPGNPTQDVRLCAGLYSGWSALGRTILFFPVHEEQRPVLSIATPRKEIQLGHGSFREKGTVRCAPVVLAFPPAMENCQASLRSHTRLEGTVRVAFERAHIHDPVHQLRAQALTPEPRFVPAPRYPLREYLKRYLQFLDNPEMFIELGTDCGLFHRGFYNCTSAGSFRSAVSDVREGKQYAGALLYKHRAIGEHRNDPRTHPRMQVFGSYANMCEPLCDMVWGGAHNVQAAYFLYRVGALPSKADRIVRTVLDFRNGQGRGFQLEHGPARGGWWNAYQPRLDAFSNRYFEPLLGTPDQGLFDYYLATIDARKYYPSEQIAARIKANCEYFLEPRLGADSLFHHAYDLRGNVGYTREKIRYPSASPCASLLAALGFLSCYRVTGERRWKSLALKVARNTVEKILHRYQWGYLEYDTLGTDTMAIARELLALSELYREFPKPWLRDAAELTMRHLNSYQHHTDLGLDRYMNNEKAWGGTPHNCGGFVHGHTYNSAHGLQMLTLRSDLSEGLLAYYETFGDALAYESLLKYFNFLTHHQVTRRDTQFGFGSTSEHLNMDAGYVQDTFQVSNAMPFGVDFFIGSLHLSSSNSRITGIILVRNHMRVRFQKTSLLEFSVSHPSSRTCSVSEKGRLHHMSETGSLQLKNYGGQWLEVVSANKPRYGDLR